MTDSIDERVRTALREAEKKLTPEEIKQGIKIRARIRDGVLTTVKTKEGNADARCS